MSSGVVARPAVGRTLTAAALVLAAVNLRPALASVGALLPGIEQGLGMNPVLAGALTSLPSLCFAAAGAFGPRLARRMGSAGALAAAMLVIAAGLVGRALAADVPLFLLGSAAAVAAIGIVNVLMPVVVREYAPNRVGTATGRYSVTLVVAAAAAAAVAVPSAAAFGGWRPALAVWSIPAFGAAAVWLVVWLVVSRRTPVTGGRPRVAGPLQAETSALPRGTARAPARRVAAWALAAFFGLQAAGAYVVLGWLPALLQDGGVAAGRAGLLLAVVPAVGAPFAFLVPASATTTRRRVWLVVTLGALAIVGYAGLLVAPAGAPWVWVVVLGVAQSVFPLALAFIGLGGRDAAEVARLSTFAQSVGYVIATPFPFVVGVLHADSGGWVAPLVLMIAVAVAQTMTGVTAAASVDKY